MVDRFSKEYGGLEKWPKLYQAEVLLYAISNLPRRIEVAGYWIEYIHRICFQWSMEGNSGVKAGKSTSREDARGLNETHTAEYLCGKQHLYFNNFQHWTASGLEDDTWTLSVSEAS